MFKELNATKKGLITGIVMVVIELFCVYVLKLPINGKEQYILFVVYILGILWSLFSYKQLALESNTFKDYFSVGFRTFVVATLLMVIFTFIFFTFDTTYRDAGIAVNNELLIKEGNHTPSEIESNANQLKKIFMPVMLGITTFKYLIIGALVTATGAGFLMEKK